MSVRHYTGWADQRLAEAFDLVDEVRRAHNIPEDGLPEICALLVEIDRADRVLADALEARKEAA